MRLLVLWYREYVPRRLWREDDRWAREQEKRGTEEMMYLYNFLGPIAWGSVPGTS